MKKRLSFLVAGICLLLLPACSESELLDRDGNGTEVNLKPGEKAVTFTLEAPSSGAVPATRAAGDANDEVTLPGESDIDKLDIYCFVQKLNVALSSQLERIYRYSKNGTGNDFVLMAAAGGYKLGIGVPEDNELRRFLIIANDHVLSRSTMLGTTTYTQVLDWTMGAVMDEIGSLPSPFPMSAKVLKPVLMNDGSYIYQEEPFSAEDLEKGVKVQLQRRVARFDIDNPISDFFEVTGINVKSYADYGMFNETTSDIRIISYGKNTCTNADFIAGAFYCYPGGATTEGSNGADVEIFGNYLGAPATITASSDGKLQPNSRYIVRIHDGNKLNATLEVAPWNEGGKIDASPTGPYAKEVNVSVPEVSGGDGSSRYYAYIDTAKHIIRVAGDWQENSTSEETMSVTDVEENLRVNHPFLELKGANGETAPVGVILSEALKGRVRIHNNAVTGITQLEMIPTEEEIEAPLLASESGFVSSPASITFVTQPGGDGSELKYEEWTLIEDFFIYSYLESPRCIVMSEYMPEVSLRSTQTTQTTKLADGTTVTLSPYINDMGLLIGPVMEMERSKTNFYIEKGREWLGRVIMSEKGNADDDLFSASSYLVYPSQDNNTGEAREGVVVVRSVVNDDSNGNNAKTTGTIDERRYRIIQPPITPQTQTGLAAYVEFVLEPEHTAKELRMEGNTIYMNYGTYSDNAGGIELLKGSMKAANQSGILAPFSLHSEGRKPVRVFIPNDCNWLTVSALRSGMLYINPSDNFIRTFLVEPNKTSKSRRVSFTIQTCVNGKVKDTVYQLVQEPTKKGTGGGGPLD